MNLAAIKARERRMSALWFGIHREIRAWEGECLPLFAMERYEYLQHLHDVAAAVDRARLVLAGALLRIEPPQPPPEEAK